MEYCNRSYCAQRVSILLCSGCTTSGMPATTNESALKALEGKYRIRYSVLLSCTTMLEEFMFLYCNCVNVIHIFASHPFLQRASISMGNLCYKI